MIRCRRGGLEPDRSERTFGAGRGVRRKTSFVFRVEPGKFLVIIDEEIIDGGGQGERGTQGTWGILASNLRLGTASAGQGGVMSSGLGLSTASAGQRRVLERNLGIRVPYQE